MIIKTGDIILQNWKPKNKILRFFVKIMNIIDRGPANHVLLCVYGDKYLEATPERVGFREFSPYDDQFAVLRHRTSINVFKFNKVVKEYLSTSKLRYSILGLLNASIGALTYRISGRRIQLFKDSINPYCSELVAEIYKKYGLPFKISDDIITPNDIYRNKDFVIIKEFRGDIE